MSEEQAGGQSVAEKWTVTKRHNRRFRLEPLGIGDFSNEDQPLQIATAHNAALEQQNAAVAAMRQALVSAHDSLGHNKHFSNDGCDICAALASDAGQSLLKELEELRAWKREALQVESQWDLQAIGKLLGAKLGTSIRPLIQPALAEQRKRIETLEAGLERARQDFCSYFHGFYMVESVKRIDTALNPTAGGGNAKEKE